MLACRSAITAYGMVPPWAFASRLAQARVRGGLLAPLYQGVSPVVATVSGVSFGVNKTDLAPWGPHLGEESLNSMDKLVVVVALVKSLCLIGGVHGVVEQGDGGTRALDISQPQQSLADATQLACVVGAPCSTHPPAGCSHRLDMTPEAS